MQVPVCTSYDQDDDNLGTYSDTTQNEGESDEEVWEPFTDGQCSRTSPFNHRTIRRWRQISCPGPSRTKDSSDLSQRSVLDERKHLSAQLPAISVCTSPYSMSGPAGPLSAPSSITWETRRHPSGNVNVSDHPATLNGNMSDKMKQVPIFPFNSRSKFPATATQVSDQVQNRRRDIPPISSASTIPVGIAVARQRSTEKCLSSRNKESETIDSPNNEPQFDQVPWNLPPYLWQDLPHPQYSWTTPVSPHYSIPPISPNISSFQMMRESRSSQLTTGTPPVHLPMPEMQPHHISLMPSLHNSLLWSRFCHPLPGVPGVTGVPGLHFPYHPSSLTSAQISQYLQLQQLLSSQQTQFDSYPLSKKESLDQPTISSFPHIPLSPHLISSISPHSSSQAIHSMDLSSSSISVSLPPQTSALSLNSSAILTHSISSLSQSTQSSTLSALSQLSSTIGTTETEDKKLPQFHVKLENLFKKEGEHELLSIVAEKPDFLINVTDEAPVQISVPVPFKVPEPLSIPPTSMPKQETTDQNTNNSFGISKTESIEPEPSFVPKQESSQDEIIDVKNIKKEAELEANNCFNGLNLLTEGIEHLERMEPKCEQRSVRHLSLDSSLHNGNSGLGILCDIANKRIQEMEVSDIKLSTTPNRISRSKSLDHISPRENLSNVRTDFNRNFRSPRSEKDIKDFIAAKQTKYHSIYKGCKSLSRLDPENMESWEMKMRINLAEIQKTYKQKYKELYKLQHFNSKKDKQKKCHKRKLLDSKNWASKVNKNKMVDIKKQDVVEQEKRPELAKNMETGTYKDRNDNPIQNKNISVSFSETFAKFQKSYLLNRQKSEIKSPVTNKPNPFENLIRLSRVTNDTNNDEAAALKKTTPITLSSDVFFAKISDTCDKSYESQNLKMDKNQVESRERNNDLETKNIYSNLAKNEISTILESQQVYNKKLISDNIEEANLIMENCKSFESNKLGQKSRTNFYVDIAETENLQTQHFEKYSLLKNLNVFQKRKAEKPRKQSNIDGDITETIVLKKQKRLNFESLAFDSGSNVNGDTGKFTVKSFDYIIPSKIQKRKKKSKKNKKKRMFDSDSENLKMMREQKHKERHQSNEIRNSTKEIKRAERIKYKQLKKEAKLNKKIAHDIDDSLLKESTWQPQQYSILKKLNETENASESKKCDIMEQDLRDGLRILTRIGGHFYPGRVTEISPPDIYGILVDKERGNKPHIYSREEVLKQAVLEVRPGSVGGVSVGTRVCAYWSSKYQYLHPGTIAPSGTPDPKLDGNYVNVELDDGDSRDIHIDYIRYLPQDYPPLVHDPDPMASLFSTKRKSRALSIEDNENAIRPIKESKPEYTSSIQIHGTNYTKHKNDNIKKISKHKKNKRHSTHSHSSSKFPSDLKVKIKASDVHILPQIKSPELEFYQDSAFISGDDSNLEDFEPTEEALRNRLPSSDKSKIAAFLPPQQLWQWAGKGQKRAKGKARKLFHRGIYRGKEMLQVGDSAVFLSTGRPDRPYIGKLESMWESWGGNMKVRVKWFYHAAETEGAAQGGKRVEDLTLPGALFESCHYDENDVQTISHKCQVLEYRNFVGALEEDPSKVDNENNDLYYLAGTYDPVVGTLDFHPAVF